MNGHHLILGELVDFITGETLSDTHDERYRQKIARLLVDEKGYRKEDIIARTELMVEADEKKGIIFIDFSIKLLDKFGMIIKYAPGSLVTRYRPVLAASRLIAPYQIPLAVVTNGKKAHILEGNTGKILYKGWEHLPKKDRLMHLIETSAFPFIGNKRANLESRIVYAYEIDGACPCDDSICRL